jgi:hypothetical protein
MVDATERTGARNMAPQENRIVWGRALVGCPILNFAFFAKFRVGMLREQSAGTLCPAIEHPHSSQNRA